MISLIVPLYNAARHVPPLLGFLRAQRAQDFETVLVDDGSQDETLPLLSAAQTVGDLRLTVLQNAHTGVSAARNAGLSAAKGEFVAFVDADDVLVPTYVQTLLSLAQRDADVTRFAFTRVPADATALPENASAQTPVREVGSPALLQEFLSDPKRFGVYGFLYKRRFLQEEDIRFPEGYAYYEDYDFLVRALACAGSILETGSVLYGYRQAVGSAMMRYGANRILCLSVADELCAFLQKKDHPAADDFVRWYKARLYFAALWQACAALRSPASVRRLLRLSGGKPLLRRLCTYPDRKVALLSAMLLASPSCASVALHAMAGKKTHIAAFTRRQEENFFAELETHT